MPDMAGHSSGTPGVCGSPKPGAEPVLEGGFGLPGVNPERRSPGDSQAWAVPITGMGAGAGAPTPI